VPEEGTPDPFVSRAAPGPRRDVPPTATSETAKRSHAPAAPAGGGTNAPRLSPPGWGSKVGGGETGGSVGGSVVGGGETGGPVGGSVVGGGETGGPVGGPDGGAEGGADGGGVLGARVNGRGVRGVFVIGGHVNGIGGQVNGTGG